MHQLKQVSWKHSQVIFHEQMFLSYRSVRIPILTSSRAYAYKRLCRAHKNRAGDKRLMHSCLKLLSILRMNKHGTPEPDVFSPTGLKVASLTVQAPVCARLHMTTHPRIRHKTIDSCTMCSMPDPHVHHMHIHIPSLTLKCQQACHIFLTA